MIMTVSMNAGFNDSSIIEITYCTFFVSCVDGIIEVAGTPSFSVLEDGSSGNVTVCVAFTSLPTGGLECDLDVQFLPVPNTARTDYMYFVVSPYLVNGYLYKCAYA